MLLLIDFEATSVDTQTARITEIGAVLCHNDFTPDDMALTLSQLVYESGYPALTPENIAVTGITQEMLLKDGVPLADAVGTLIDMVDLEQVDYVIAYNRKYDEQLFKAEVKRHTLDLDPRINQLMQVPWLCAMEDIESNYAFKSWRQMHIALEYGITVNPKLLHRAINDVELMRQILKESGTTPEAMYKFQQSPWIYIAANVKPPWTDNGKSSTEAKALGFKWQNAGDDRIFEKTWVKRIKPHQYEALVNQTTLQLKEVR